MTWTTDDMERLLHLLKGGPFYFGLLQDGEVAAAEHLIKEGKAQRTYDNIGGFLGLAKIELIK